MPIFPVNLPQQPVGKIRDFCLAAICETRLCELGSTLLHDKDVCACAYLLWFVCAEE